MNFSKKKKIESFLMISCNRYRAGVDMEQLKNLFLGGNLVRREDLFDDDRDDTGITMNVICHVKMVAGFGEGLQVREEDAQQRDRNQTVIPLRVEEADQFPSGMAMTNLHLLFIKQAMRFGFVTKNGQLIGILRRKKLENFLKMHRNSKPKGSGRWDRKKKKQLSEEQSQTLISENSQAPSSVPLKTFLFLSEDFFSFRLVFFFSLSF